MTDQTPKAGEIVLIDYTGDHHFKKCINEYAHKLVPHPSYRLKMYGDHPAVFLPGSIYDENMAKSTRFWVYKKYAKVVGVQDTPHGKEIHLTDKYITEDEITEITKKSEEFDLFMRLKERFDCAEKPDREHLNGNIVLKVFEHTLKRNIDITPYQWTKFHREICRKHNVDDMCQDPQTVLKLCGFEFVNNKLDYIKETEIDKHAYGHYLQKFVRDDLTNEQKREYDAFVAYI